MAPHSSLPDPNHIFPFVGLFSLIPLDQEILRKVGFVFYHRANDLRLENGCWVPVPPGTSSVTRIYNANQPTNNDPSLAELSLTTQPERHLWRLPTPTSPILASLMYHTSYLLESDIEEIDLIIELRRLLHPSRPRGPKIAGRGGTSNTVPLAKEGFGKVSDSGSKVGQVESKDGHEWKKGRRAHGENKLGEWVMKLRAFISKSNIVFSQLSFRG
jgi:hypothetical protein